MMEKAIREAEAIVTKWDVNGSAYAKITSLFYESREEALAFIAAVIGLKRAMHHLYKANPTSARTRLLARAQNLMATAMARLQKELYQTLATNRSRLDSDSLTSARSSLSSSDEAYQDDSSLGTSLTEESAPPPMPTSVMDDIRSIVDCMLTCGYSKECVRVYVTARRSMVDEGLHRLGHVPLSARQMRKLEWEALERQIRRWVAASRPAVTTVLAGESFLCEYVFASSDAAKEAVFAEVAGEPAAEFLKFPEMVTTKRKSSPEKIFVFLNLYEAISELYPEIESLFPYRSTEAVPSQARASLENLAGFIRQSLADFDKAVQQHWTKENVPGGDVHPLSRYVMNYLSFLADYAGTLGEILADHPLLHGQQLPEPFVELLTLPPSAPSSPARGEDPPAESPALSSHVAWLILLLLGKVDASAATYGDAALSYLFLANNVRYVVDKVRKSNLRYLLGEEWVEKHGEKARSFARSYERLGWRRVVEAVPKGAVGLKEAEERMTEFGAAFEEACRKQSGWVVKDRWMRDEIKVSVAGKVMVPYREFYHMYVGLVRKERGRVGLGSVRFTPEDVGNHLSDLFYGVPAASPSRPGPAKSADGQSGSSSGSSKRRMWRSS